MKWKLLTVVILAVALIGACTSPMAQMGLTGGDDAETSAEDAETSAEGEKGTLLFSIGGELNAKTFIPDESTEIESFDISGSGPEGASFTVEGFNGSGSIEKTLAAGLWTIQVIGNNNQETAVGSGQTTVTLVSGETTNASVTVTPVEGNGTFDLSINWDPDVIFGDATVSATITPMGQSEESITDNDISDNSFDLSEELETGYYLLSFVLSDDTGDTVYGFVESVQMVGGLTTTGTLEITEEMVNTVYSDFNLDVVQDMNDPIEISMSASPGPVVEIGDSVELSATPDPADDGSYNYSWYVDAELVTGETESSITLESLESGVHTVNVVINNGESMSSASAQVTVPDQVSANRILEGTTSVPSLVHYAQDGYVELKQEYSVDGDGLIDDQNVIDALNSQSSTAPSYTPTAGYDEVRVPRPSNDVTYLRRTVTASYYPDGYESVETQSLTDSDDISTYVDGDEQGYRIYPGVAWQVDTDVWPDIDDNDNHKSEDSGVWAPIIEFDLHVVLEWFDGDPNNGGDLVSVEELTIDVTDPNNTYD